MLLISSASSPSFKSSSAICGCTTSDAMGAAGGAGAGAGFGTVAARGLTLRAPRLGRGQLHQRFDTLTELRRHRAHPLAQLARELRRFRRRRIRIACALLAYV